MENSNKNVHIQSNESSGKKEIRWSLDQTFFIKEKYKNFRNRYFNFVLKKNLHDQEPFAVLKVDLMTITTGPFQYSVRLNHMSRQNEKAGVLSFKVEIEQLQRLTLTLSSINTWLVSDVDRALYVTFRIITYEDSINSEKSKSILGEYLADSSEYQTKFKWDKLVESNDKDLSLELVTSIESLKSSSLQVCFWRDKTFNRFQANRDCIYKRFLSSDGEDYNEISKKNFDSDFLNNDWKISGDGKSYKSCNSFKLKNKVKLAPSKRSSERQNQNYKLSDEIVSGSTSIPKSLRKKSVKRRGNIENLEGECYISFQKLL